MSVIITNDTHDGDRNDVHHARFPAIHWGAIFAGIVVGLAVQLVLAVLGLAAGLSAIDMRETNAGVENPATWAAVWHGFSMLTAAFVGGYVAARMSGLLRKTDGLLHGFVAWGATTLLFAVLSMTAAGAFFGGVFYNATSMATAQSVDSKATTAPMASMTSQIESLLQRSVGTDQTIEIRPEYVTQLQSLIAAGDREGAIRYLSETVGFNATQSSTLVDQALIVSGSPENASPQAQNTANEVVESASTVSWSVFVAVILSLILGLSGGALGAINARRLPQAADSL